MCLFLTNTLAVGWNWQARHHTRYLRRKEGCIYEMHRYQPGSHVCPSLGVCPGKRPRDLASCDPHTSCFLELLWVCVRSCARMHVEVREWLIGVLDFHHMSYRGQIQDSGLIASSFIPWATFLALLNCCWEEMGHLTTGISRHLLIEVEKGSGALNVTWEGLACFVYLVLKPGSNGWSTWRVFACKQNSAPSQHIPEPGSGSKVVSPFQLGIWGHSSLCGAAPCAVECPTAS